MYRCTIRRRGMTLRMLVQAIDYEIARSIARKRIFARWFWTPDTYSLWVEPA